MPPSRNAVPVSAGDRLPVLELPNVINGTATPLLRGRGPHLLVLTRSAGCPPCSRFLERLKESSSIDEWGAHVVVIASGAAEEVRGLRTSTPGAFDLLADPEQRFEVRTGLCTPALLVTDEWGEIYLVHPAGEEHDFPAMDELEEWLRFVAVQCPECEAPEGLWREL